MTLADTAPRSEAGEPNEFGYRTFTLGQFHFSRDEYFAYVTWPTGRHVMSVDAFLRALQREVLGTPIERRGRPGKTPRNA